MTIHTINGLRIQTSFDYPPIPGPRHGLVRRRLRHLRLRLRPRRVFTTCPVGHGSTEQEAIADLLSKIEDAAA